MNLFDTLRPVHGRGHPPTKFLEELISWARLAPEEIFAPNNHEHDVFNRLLPLLGTEKADNSGFFWSSSLHRRAALCELLRCLAGFESSWHWLEGVDVTNHTSQTHIEGQETGIFQVSYDSLNLGDASLRDCVVRYCHTDHIQMFIDRMKTEHEFALEYCARLLRFSYLWDGPIKRHEIDSSLSRAACSEFEVLLS